MTKEEFEKLMGEQCGKIQSVFVKMIKITQEFKKESPDTTLYSMPELDRRISDIAEGAAWFVDDLNSVRKDQRGSMTKKIRKALGYTIP